MKLVVYIDIDAFAVAVERRGRRDLAGRAVVVSTQSADAGAVACVSYEARKAGLWPGMPVSHARRRAPGTIFLPANPIACEKQSRRLLSYLHHRTPAVELDKVDGFFLDLTGCERWMRVHPTIWVARLVCGIFDELKLPASFGLASNKLLARIAARVAKPAGAAWVLPGLETEFLAPISVGLLPGVGRTTRRELREFGVHTIGQLRALGEDSLRKLYGPIGGNALWRHCRGLCDEPVTPTPVADSLDYEHIFSEDTCRTSDIEAAASLLAQQLAWGLRSGGYYCSAARIDLSYADGHTAGRIVKEPLHPQSHGFAHEEALIASVRQAAVLAFARRVRVRALHLHAIVRRAAEAQFDFFEVEKQQRLKRLDHAIEQVRARHGFESLLLAGGTGRPARLKVARQATLEDLW